MCKVAIRYLDQGLSVVPVYTPEIINNSYKGWYESELTKAINDAKNIGIDINDAYVKQAKINLMTDWCKRPIGKWKEYQSRIPTINEVNEWFTNYPDANIGILTGKVSNVFVLDVDGSAGEEHIKKMGGVPKTVETTTGRGRHLYFALPGNIEVRNGANPELKLDIRGNGGYVVAPPSKHCSGRNYAWVEGRSIHDIKPTVAPQWVIDFAVKKKTAPKKETVKETSNINVVPAGMPSSNNSSVELFKEGCSQGGRNDSATKFIGRWHRLGLTRDEIWELALSWNSRNKPPLDEQELAGVFTSIISCENKQVNKIDPTTFLTSMDNIVKGFNVKDKKIQFAGDNLKELQDKMGGGLIGGNLYLLGGVPSSGKTALSNNIADNLCLNGTPVIFFSYDDGKQELNCRTISRFTNIPIETLNNGFINGNSQQALSNNQDLKNIFAIKHIVNESIKVDDWDSIIDDIVGKYNVKPVIFIDYIKKLRTKKIYKEERLRMDAIVNALTNLAKSKDVPIIAISELNREAYRSGQVLSMAAFKETGSLEYEASWLGIMAPVTKVKGGQLKITDKWQSSVASGNMSLSVLKTKRGTGKTGNVQLCLEINKMIFKSDFGLDAEFAKIADSMFV